MILLPFILLALLPLVDSPTWKNQRARLRRTSHDRSTAFEITVLGALGVSSGLIAMSLIGPVFGIGAPGRITGALIAIAGASLRFWSIRTLGQFFTLTLQINEAQQVIQSGPYRWVRHPSYLGGELALLGIGLTCGNWVSAVLMVTPLIIAHVRRIKAEELMMREALGVPWVVYARATARLIPYVY